MIPKRDVAAPQTSASAQLRLPSLLRRWQALLIPLGIALLARIIVFVGADLLFWLAQSHLHHALPFSGPVAVWQRKDALWYLAIAQGGYDYSPVAASRANFFPLYPALIALVTPLAAALHAPQPAALAGMAISWVTFAGACVALYQLALRHFDQRVALGSVLLLATFPFSLYYGAAYTESLYLILAVGALLAVERGRWWLAAALAGIASASRPPGLLIGALVALAYLLDWLRTRHPLRVNLLSLALTPLGALAYMLYCWVRWGDPFAYVKTSRAGWNGGHLQLNGVRYIVNMLFHPVNWLGTGDPTYILTFFAAVLMLGFLALTPLVLRLLGPTYALFALGSILAPILDFPNANSLGRYLSVVFPVFIVLAYLLRGRPRLLWTLSTTGALMLVAFASYFIAGYGLS